MWHPVGHNFIKTKNFANFLRILLLKQTLTKNTLYRTLESRHYKTNTWVLYEFGGSSIETMVFCD